MRPIAPAVAMLALVALVLGTAGCTETAIDPTTATWIGRDTTPIKNVDIGQTDTARPRPPAKRAQIIYYRRGRPETTEVRIASSLIDLDRRGGNAFVSFDVRLEIPPNVYREETSLQGVRSIRFSIPRPHALRPDPDFKLKVRGDGDMSPGAVIWYAEPNETDTNRFLRIHTGKRDDENDSEVELRIWDIDTKLRIVDIQVDRGRFKFKERGGPTIVRELDKIWISLGY
jgi:hypothetical protein